MMISFGEVLQEKMEHGLEINAPQEDLPDL